MLSRFIVASGVSLGWLAVAAVGVAVVAYCLGCFNGAVVVSRYILRDDVRNHGSGNAGLTNFYRVFGGPLTAVVILSDVCCFYCGAYLTRTGYVSKILGGDILPAGSYVPVYVPVSRWEGHPIRRRHCPYDRLAGGAGGMGRICYSGRGDAICIPWLVLGRVFLPLCIRVCIPGFTCHLAVCFCGRVDSLEAPRKYCAHS